MVRGTAMKMEEKGITYPAEAIVDWLRTADITHISNEVSFREGCPPPTIYDGTVMCSNPKYIELLKYVGTDVIELTGNHLWDYGVRYLSDTIKTYKDLGWGYFGGGLDLQDSIRPYTVTVNGNRIAFIGCNWFGADWASDQYAGSAPCGRAADAVATPITGIAPVLEGTDVLILRWLWPWMTRPAPLARSTVSRASASVSARLRGDRPGNGG